MGMYRYRKEDGMAIGTQGWEADHERAKCASYTGLWKGSQVIALLVAKGPYDGLANTINKNGDFIVRACNSHDQLIKAANMLLSCMTVAGWENDPAAIAMRDALKAAGE